MSGRMNDPKIETVSFSDGASVTNVSYQLDKGVTLKVHSEVEAVLTIDTGCLEFAWNPATENAFRSLDAITGAELLTTIAGNPL